MNGGGTAPLSESPMVTIVLIVMYGWAQHSLQAAPEDVQQLGKGYSYDITLVQYVVKVYPIPLYIKWHHRQQYRNVIV